MTDPRPPTPVNPALPSLDDANHRLELARVDLQIKLAAETAAFLDFDKAFNLRILTFTDLLIELAKKDPTVLVRTEDPRLDEILELLQARAASDARGGCGGGDVSGGAGEAQEVVDIIRQIVEIFTSVVKDEKAFFLSILKLLLCGCKGTGW